MQDNPHKDHRSRLKARFAEEGLLNFKPHNILELLLFYAIPRRDTNELAHALLERFGSLSEVFDADIDALQEVSGIGENTAVLIKMIPQLSRAYLLDKDTRYADFGSKKKVGKYLVKYFMGETDEKLVALFFNTKIEMIAMLEVSKGTPICTDVSARKIAEFGFAKKAAFFVLAHNHPDGNSKPSRNDYAVTSSYQNLFRNFSMPVLEHFVIGSNGFETIIDIDPESEWVMG